MTQIQPTTKRVSSPRLARATGQTLLYFFLTVGAMLSCFPFFWMLLTSFKTYGEAIATPPVIFPEDWGLRLTLVTQLVLRYPLVLVLFVGWTWLDWHLSRRISDPVIRGVCFTIYLALFFVLGNLQILGNWRLSALWRERLTTFNLELPAFFENYTEAWARAPFVHYFKNSIIMSTATPLLIVLTSAPAAYAFARLEFPAKGVMFMLYLATMMVPAEVLVIPNFITITELGWKNTYYALIVPFAVSVMSIFFLRQFFRSVPNDLYDAATIDGCGHTRFLISIAMPLAQPALVSTAMFNFLSSWNALLWPLLVTDHETMRPISLGLAAFSTEAGMQVQLYMAAATFTIVPIIVLFLFVQKQFIEGIARSGIK